MAAGGNRNSEEKPLVHVPRLSLRKLVEHQGDIDTPKGSRQNVASDRGSGLSRKSAHFTCSRCWNPQFLYAQFLYNLVQRIPEVGIKQVANFQRHDKLMPVSYPAPISHLQAFFDGFPASGI